MACKTHPDAPHGFLRNSSHLKGRYVCECEYWEPSMITSEPPRTFQVKAHTFLSLGIEKELVDFVKYFRLDDKLTMKSLVENYPDVARKLVEGLSSLNKTQRVCM